jgi:SCP-2 sterol transfer family
MTMFETDDQVYATVGEILRYVASGSGLAPRLRRIDQTWRFDLRDPASVITARFKRTGALKVDFGSSSEPPDVTLSMSADDAHRYFLGIFNPQLAIDDGSLRVSGSPSEFIAAVPQIRSYLMPVYREMLLRDNPALMAAHPGIDIPPAVERQPYVRMGPGDTEAIARAESEAG